jgi:dTDP-glucose 4,6-dehydratase
MLRVLVTGGCGFIGSNFVRLLLREERDVRVVNLDLLTYAGNPRNLEDVSAHPGYRFVQGDIRDPETVRPLVEDADWVVNFAAESHVDRSTKEEAGDFIRTNVYGTTVLLEAVRRARSRARFLQIGTDEVYGDVPPGVHPDEQATLCPSSPYSASKAGGDHQTLAFHRTFGTDALVSRCTNNYGPYQYPEKLVPLFITNAMDDEALPLYDGGTQIRDWLFVEDHCRALLRILREGRSGEIYNVGAQRRTEVTNAELTAMVLRKLGKPDSLIRHVRGLRPGHDQRYAVQTRRIRELGWEPRVDLEQGLDLTIEWYRARRDWWAPLKTGEYRAFYRRHYRLDEAD